MLSIASETDIPVVLGGFLSPDGTCSGEDAGGDGALGFHWRPLGLGRGGGGPDVVGPDVALFSNAAILSRRELGFGFGGGD